MTLSLPLNNATTPSVTRTPCSAQQASEHKIDDSFPSWLTQEQAYIPRKDRESFLGKNTLKITGMLKDLKIQRGGLEAPESLAPLDKLLVRVDPAFRILGLLVTIFCVSAASNMFFVYIILGIFLVWMATKKGSDIIEILRPALIAAVFAALIMIPAIFIGQTSSFLRISIKVFITVGCVINLSRSVAYNELIAGFRTYHIPGIIIFIVDITLKYIVMLGEIATHAFDALRSRSVGRNTHKQQVFGGIAGTLFLRLHDSGTRMYEAMECRGFVGDYEVPKRTLFSLPALCYSALMVMQIVLFFYLEGMF